VQFVAITPKEKQRMGAPPLLSQGLLAQSALTKRGRSSATGFCRLLHQENQVDQVAFEQLAVSSTPQSMMVVEGYDHLHVCWERMSGVQSGKIFQCLLP